MFRMLTLTPAGMIMTNRLDLVRLYFEVIDREPDEFLVYDGSN
jgi:hypothetical protein